MMSEQDKRVSKLEQLAGVTDEVYAVRYGAEKSVKVAHSGEVLTVDEFWSKYPEAALIHVVYKNTPPDITVSWDDDE
jgi:hypothetical protein